MAYRRRNQRRGGGDEGHSNEALSRGALGWTETVCMRHGVTRTLLRRPMRACGTASGDQRGWPSVAATLSGRGWSRDRVGMREPLRMHPIEWRLGAEAREWRAQRKKMCSAGDRRR